MSSWVMGLMMNESGVRTVADLVHFEQNVNDRNMTSAAPAIDKRFLPESGDRVPLKWRKLPRRDVEVFQAKSHDHLRTLEEVSSNETMLMPVHPMEEQRFSSDDLVTSGHIRFSASYRTVFFEPEQGGPFDNWIRDDRVLMIKLHLQDALPGIAGDRRLTRDKIEKCVLLSEILPREVASEPFADRFEIVPEFFGMSHADGGVLFRLLPGKEILPFFSLYSHDRTDAEKRPIIVDALLARYGENSAPAASDLGRIIAAPLVRSLLSGFRRGFSLEMHAQNTLFRMGDEALIDTVYFRDMEGVVLSDKFRDSRGLQPLFPSSSNPELVDETVAMRRWFSRNVDHDLGRIFKGILQCLLQAGFFDQHDVRAAVASIRSSVQESIKQSQLQALNGFAYLLPFSRSPYGNGRRLGHYYRTTFR